MGKVNSSSKSALHPLEIKQLQTLEK